MDKNNLEKIKKLYKKKDRKNCLLEYEKFFNKDKGIFDAICYYFSCLMEKNRFREAIKILNEVIEIEEGFCYFRGQCYFWLKQYDLAIKDFKKATELEPRNKNFWNALALAYFESGNSKDAYKSIDKAMEVSDGKDYYPLVFKVLFLKIEEKTDEAFEAFLELRKKYPSKKNFLSKPMRSSFDSLSDDFIKKHAKK